MLYGDSIPMATGARMWGARIGESGSPGRRHLQNDLAHRTAAQHRFHRGTILSQRKLLGGNGSDLAFPVPGENLVHHTVHFGPVRTAPAGIAGPPGIIAKVETEDRDILDQDN